MNKLSTITLTLSTFAVFFAQANILTVTVNNIKNDVGNIGCALHTASDSFPMSSAASQQWHPSTKGTLTCIFDVPTPGAYAVAVSHDENKNGKTDTNFLGIPKEAWGVSNNVRPLMRAPSFEEAKFEFPDVNDITINIE